MRRFLDEEFLLTTKTAARLYFEYAKDLPIVDYHCHIDPKEIYEDRRFPNITRLWLERDHYKWRFMRACGVGEEYITGDASDFDKFLKWSECLGRAVGNPLYHWSHLELKRYFGYEGILNGRTARHVWEICDEKLGRLSARGMIEAAGVSLICTTDDPADTLDWHGRIRKDENFKIEVLPAWRPDRAMNIEKRDYLDYLFRLSQAAGTTIEDFKSLKEALCRRMDYFGSHGCKISDHGLEKLPYLPASDKEIEAIFAKRKRGERPTVEEEAKFKTAFLLFAGEEYAKRGWVMQLHTGCIRDNNTRMYARLGADTGFDCIGESISAASLSAYLDALNNAVALPKTIIYSLNPQDNAMIDSVAGCFQEGYAVSKIQHGSAWWFNDHKTGMRDHLVSLAAMGNLSGFVGMLTDSRSFLSYTRHEYFRRILCDVLGRWVEGGEYPCDYDVLGAMVRDICYNNAVDYFEFPLQRR